MPRSSPDAGDVAPELEPIPVGDSLIDEWPVDFARCKVNPDPRTQNARFPPAVRRPPGLYSLGRHAREAVMAAGDGMGFVWLCADHSAMAKDNPAQLLRLLGLT